MTKDIATRKTQSVTFQLLGPVTAYLNAKPVDMGTQRERRLLVALLSTKGQPVSRDTLVEWVWDDIPANPAQALYEVTGDLRQQRLAPLGLADRLHSKDAQTRLDISNVPVDAHEFQAMCQRAHGLGTRARSRLLRDALALPRGEPLAGVHGRQVAGYRRELENDLRNAEIMFIQAEVRLSRAEARVPDLTRLFAERPDDSKVTGLFMIALHALNTPADALAVFRRHRECLVDDGLEVPRRLRDLQVRILRDEDDLGEAGAAFLGGRPGTPEEAADTDDDTESGAPAGGRVSHGPAVAETVFNGPVNTYGNSVFGIQIGGFR